MESGLRSLFIGFETLDPRNLRAQRKLQNLGSANQSSGAVAAATPQAEYEAAIRRLHEHVWTSRVVGARKSPFWVEALWRSCDALDRLSKEAAMGFTDKAKQMADEAAAKTKGAAADLQEKAGPTMEKAKVKAGELGEKAKPAWDKAKQEAADLAGKAKDALKK